MSADNQNQNPFESEIETNGRAPSPPVHAEGNSDGDIAHAEPSDPEKDDSAIAQDKGKMRESNTEPSELEKGALNKETGATEKATSPSPTNDGEKPEAKHVEGEAKPTLFTRVKRHLRKYWYWYLIADVIILAIVLPIVYVLLCSSRFLCVFLLTDPLALPRAYRPYRRCWSTRARSPSFRSVCASRTRRTSPFRSPSTLPSTLSCPSDRIAPS